MTTTRIAHPAHQSTTEPAYVLRGLGIFELHRDALLESYQGGGRWLVPSGSEGGKVYEVRVGRRPERNRCECRGFASYGHCSHLVAVPARRGQEAELICWSAMLIWIVSPILRTCASALSAERWRLCALSILFC